jgi:hypothetical protein
MRDKTSDTYRQDMPPCPLRSHCLRLADVLDGEQKALVDWQEEPLLKQLWEHVPNCPTCTEALKQIRQARALQRRMLQEVLVDGERQTPSMQVQILQAVRSTQQIARSPNSVREELPAPYEAPFAKITPARRRFRVSWRAVFSLVAALVVVFASLGIFGYFSHPKSSMHLLSAPVALATSSRWSSVVMTSIGDGDETISLFDPQANRSVTLVTVQDSESLLTPLEVSHNGANLLYSVFDGDQTTYYLRSLTGTTSLFTTSDEEGHAVWSTDDRYVFVSTEQGIVQIDVQNKKVYHIPSATGVKYLQYYRDGYLYYINGQDGATGVLNRVDITHGKVQPVTNACASGKSFWLSPVGTQVYYVCEEEQNGLFVVNSDGTQSHVVRSQSGPIIGSAADAAPLVLAYTAGKYQVAKLGANKSQDQALLNDVVPGGGLIPSGAVTVAPFGYTLVARGVYDDHEAIWYGDLTSGLKHQAMKIEKGTQVGLYGWSRMQVP